MRGDKGVSVVYYLEKTVVAHVMVAAGTLEHGLEPAHAQRTEEFEGV